MEVIIHGDKIDVTDPIRDYIESKMSKLDKYFENAAGITAKAIIRVLNENQIIEVTVPTPKFTLRAEESHKDLYAATDLVIDKLERQIRKNKTRLNRYKHEHTINLDFDLEKVEEDVKIVRRKTLEEKPMDEEEAILQKELLDLDFFVFKNVDEDCISVLYSRKDGHYGLINIK